MSICSSEQKAALINRHTATAFEPLDAARPEVIYPGLFG